MAAVAVLQLRPHPVVAMKDLPAPRRAAVAGHLPVRDRCLQRVVDGDLFAGGNFSARLERYLVPHPEIRVAGMVAAGDDLVVIEENVQAIGDGGAVVLRARSEERRVGEGLRWGGG